VRYDFAADPRLLHSFDEMARRYGTTPGRWIAKPDDPPLLSLWLDLLVSRLCAGAAVETQRQWLARNGDSVMWVMPAPGS